ncbi:caspase family protein [Gloeocapsopsis sp. IPPAS B-1203]|uniref:caspase family protein n=1 Tax=Gloeocapsopsis sp. IPPAS B-1203 TaxID=2049454 RepID=UPI000C190751|nr:caspase family protein [Gloeocapsopsis sp. IPPAS B-1203]PIG91213.1 peptidase C14 [Gloeocapsopsis sp. IPPAS B-1203]
MKRREFLKAAGGIVTALGISELDLFRLSDRYGSALAQSTPRKLALLIGINEYSSARLNGCLTDVELQRELLIHRFGFQAADIVTLSNQQATRQQIEAAFLQHLTEQAQPGDTVVFHYSGYGRCIELSDEQFSSQQNTEIQPAPSDLAISSLVPIDGEIVSSEVPIVNDLLEETLWLLLRSLRTENVTTILDTSFHTRNTLAAVPNNLRFRSYPHGRGQINPLELELQQQLIHQIAPHQLLGSPHAVNLPGLFMTASRTDQPATEAQWSGFSAGVFTYALTQSLWEATPATTIHVSLSKASGVVEQIVGQQQPQLCGQNSQVQATMPHFIPDNNISADGVVTSVEDDGKTSQLWLAGLQPTLLQYYGANSRFKVVTSLIGETDSTSQAQLQMRSRTGLTAKALLINETENTLQPGQLVQEAIRVVPRNINLNIALDPGLERIERVDATSAFSTISIVTLVNAGEQPADYLFSRVQETTPEAQSTTASRYGLFTLAQELIPNTAGEAGEAVKVAVQRLIPKLQTLLAAKLWRLTSNESSQLDVRATLEVVSAQKQVIIQRETHHSQQAKQETASGTPPTTVTGSGIPTLPIGSRIKYKISNYGDRSVYLLLIGLDSSKNAIVLFPGKAIAASDSMETTPGAQDIAIAPGATLAVPQTEIDFEWILHGPPAVCETQIIFSRSKFTQTLAALDASREDLRTEEYISVLSNPLEITQALLRDLQNASAIAPETIGAATDTYALDVNTWASFNFIYQVV